MKRSELIKQLKKEGCILSRPGSKHDIYLNPKTGQKQPVPRHSEIDNSLANHIKKYLGIFK
ncbi:MAG: type II toxin-antitoxin system HicA family toxin [Actinobacteria bacterium]|nr:type II toxin-antitoxin system HicA family toxin [Cyanobacteriota bacterium]MCL5771639.1 type II toxin-antitoxin system HicA family toxin [Actinomycetota bacterium]